MGRPDDEKVFIAEWIEAGLALLRGRLPGMRCPTWKQGELATKRALARVALQFADGDYEEAGRMLKASDRTVRRAVDDERVPSEVDFWHDLPMSGPFDDVLFPFLRVMWPHDAGAEFVNELFAWWMSDVVPRATAEGTRVVDLQNFSAFSRGVPPLAVLSAMQALTSEYPAVAPTQLASVIFSPHVPLGTFLAPIINLCPFDVKIATTPGQVIALAQAQFQKAGIQTPDLEIN